MSPDDEESYGYDTAYFPDKPEVALSYGTREESPPRLSVTLIRDTRIRIRSALDRKWLGVVVTPAAIQDEMLAKVAAALPPRIKPEAIQTTLSWHLNGRKLSKADWDYLATRLAGNLRKLKVGALSADTLRPMGGWSLIETTEANLYKSRNGNIGAMFQFRIRTEETAGLFFKQFFPLGFLPMYGKNMGVGKARWWKQPRLYVGMQLMGFFEPSKTTKQLYFSRYRATASCKEVNRYYAKGRTDECINNLHHNCWVCSRGLTDEQDELRCEFATHRTSWIKRTCRKCARVQWFYRHWPEDGKCIQCREGPLRRGIY